MATGGNCGWGYYWDCRTGCWELHTVPCPQEDLGCVYRTEEQQMCQRQLAGIQWVEAEGAMAVDQAHLQPGASVRRQELQEDPHRARHVAAARAGASQRAGVHHRPCAEPPLPSSSLSTPCEFP